MAFRDFRKSIKILSSRIFTRGKTMSRGENFHYAQCCKFVLRDIKRNIRTSLALIELNRTTHVCPRYLIHERHESKSSTDYKMRKKC